LIPMKNDKVILFVVIALLVGFILGAIVGIKYASKDVQRPIAQMPQSAEGQVPPTGPAPKPVSSEDISLLENTLKTDPNNLKALVSLGNLYFDGNQPQNAIDAYARALKVEPKNADVRTDMAVMYRNLKDYDRAVKELKQAAADDPKHTNSRFNLGIVLLHDKKDFKGAIAAWEDLLKIEPLGERADMIRDRLKQLREMAK
jgi:cytochrome c-type biogenesis protein CcmH/NrfG